MLQLMEAAPVFSYTCGDDPIKMGCGTPKKQKKVKAPAKQDASIQAKIKVPSRNKGMLSTFG